MYALCERAGLEGEEDVSEELLLTVLWLLEGLGSQYRSESGCCSRSLVGWHGVHTWVVGFRLCGVWHGLPCSEPASAKKCLACGAHTPSARPTACRLAALLPRRLPAPPPPQ